MLPSNNLRRWLISFAVGGAITSLPWLVSKLDVDWLWPINFAWLLGSVVALIFSAGNVHTYSLPVLLIANVVLIATITYFVLRSREK